MQNIDIIQKSLDYIEENLTAEISPEELAALAGFSRCHYSRIFENLVGLPVGQYITHRRLLYAAYDISLGDTVIIAALRYGFCTSSGFYRAFVREFGCGPSAYVKAHTVHRPYPIKLLQEAHIMISQKRLREVLTHWDLPSPVISDFYYAGTGQRADNLWRIGTDMVLKVGTNTAGLRRHIQISRALSDRGFPVSLPVPTTDGDDFLVEQSLYFCLSTLLQGTPVDCRALYLGDHVLPYRVGTAIGQLDQVLQDFDETFVCNAPDLLSLLTDRALPTVQAMAPLSPSFCTEFVETFSSLYPALPKQPIHRDPNPDNIILQDSGAIGFLDFELSERNIRIFDPCYGATAILSEAFTDPSLERDAWFGILRQILHGYDSVVLLTPAEWQAIPYVLLAIQLICVSYFSGFEKHKALAETNLAMLQWLIAHREQLSFA